MWTPKIQTDAAFKNTDEWIREQQQAATAKGYKPVGRGKVPAAHDVIHVPTCTSPGFQGKCERIYFSRWSMLDAVAI